MVRTLVRTSTALALAASFATAPALADATGPFGAAVQNANAALKNAMNKKADGKVAQVPPVSQQPVGGAQTIGFPTGFTYMADVSTAYPFGNIGTFGSKALRGGVDGVIGYGFNH